MMPGVVIQDVRYAIRTFARAPVFMAAALLSLAIGIGANTALFSVWSALFLRPLPYQDADRLVILWNRSPGLGIAEDWFSTAQYFDIKSGHQGLEHVAIAIGANYNLTGDGDPERVGTIRVSAGLLPILGVRAASGRLFVADDDRPGAAGVAVLAHGTWMRRYGGVREVIGKPIVLNGQPYDIVGVLPPSFSLPRDVLPTLGGAEHAEVLLNLPLAPEAATVRNREDYNILAKLKPTVSVAQAQAEMDAITARLRRDHPEFYPPNGGLTFSVVPLREQVVGDVRRSVNLLMASVGLVLLIACANVASLLLSRAVVRQREMAVRTALGAGRHRIVKQLLTESAVLALAGGVLGVMVAFASVRWIQAMGARSVPRVNDIAIDGQVLLFTLAISLVSGLFFGLVPARRLSRSDVNDDLKDATRGGAGAGALWARGHTTRRLLVVAELALSVMLLIGAGLLIRSFAQVQDVAPGFNPRNALTLELTMTGRQYSEPQSVIEMYRRIWEALEGLPGVEAAGGVSALPLSQMMAWGPITVEGRTPAAGEKFINVDQRMVGGNYFSVMEIPLRAGRLFNEHDIRTSMRVVIIDEYMAAELWPGVDPIGKRVKTGGFDAGSPWLTIVGVVGRIKQDALDAESRMALYFPHGQVPVRGMNVAIRTNGDPAALTSVVKQELGKLDPDLPLYGVRTMENRVEESLARRRFAMSLLTLFAVLALGLAALGVYAVMAYLVNQSTREFGIRLALGATPGRLLTLILRTGLIVAVLGVGLGLAGATALTRFMQSLLFGVDAMDPVTFASIPLVLIVVAALASYVPARRAARIDPVVSLRVD